METAGRMHLVNEYYFSGKLAEIERMNQEGAQVINLGIGSPDLAPHAAVIKVLQETAADPANHGYQSYKGIPVLRNAIAEWYRKWYKVALDPAKEILPLIGSKEGIMHICMTFLQEGDIALIPDPGYPTYQSAVLLSGANFRAYELNESNGYEPDLETLEKQGLQNVKMMWVNYPHMPSGQLPSNDLFEKLVRFGKKHNIMICHDNPYSFILNNDPRSMLEAKGAMDIALELNSLSKSHNMAGWRMGFLCGNSDMIGQVLKFKSNMDSGMFKPLQLASIEALKLDKDWFDGLNTIYKGRRDLMFILLNKLGCRFTNSQGGLFIWAKIPGHYKDAFDFSDEVLQRYKIFITPGTIFGSAGAQFTRASLCSPEEIILEAIRRIK
ncbi:MAG: aminotransferase class I/II-fold pyridoxal phosphate-dependent enzyme [Flavisolibacter sp.]|nr:aminotransferase class I/II-fold pyridoxal phosphate-dependent enzyme [Flavisolibacter sp.]